MSYVSLDSDYRICATVDDKTYADSNFIEYTFPEDFDFSKQSDYKIIESQLIYDPIPISSDLKIAELKANLSSTDYVPIKLAEAQLTSGIVSINDDDLKRYEQILSQRIAWRSEINKLEESV